MMTAEVVAAALVGLAVIALIIGPLAGQSATSPPQLDEPEDLEETPKGRALAALREIEFDRATGKLSDDDYQALKSKYTAEALALLRAETPAEAAGTAGTADAAVGSEWTSATSPPSAPGGSAAPADPVEALIAERLRQLQSGTARCPTCGPRPESDALYCSNCGRSLSAGGCAECGAPLIPGSRFCENCGIAVTAK